MKLTYDGHNRKPGAAAAKKARANRRLRRLVRRLLRSTVEAFSPSRIAA